MSQVEPWQVELDTAQCVLQRHLHVSSLDGFGLQGKPQAVRAAAAIFAYLQEMQPSCALPADPSAQLRGQRVHGAGRIHAAQSRTDGDDAWRRGQWQPAGASWTRA